MKKKKGLYEIKIKYDGVPVCDSVHNSFSDLEKTFEKARHKIK